MIRLRVKNWKDFQHYKKRNPPWIRLYRSILDDYEFACLPVASKAIAPLLWCLASESLEGEIHAEIDKLAFRLRVASSVLAEGLPPLVEHGFFIEISDASNVLALCKQLAPKSLSETEAETEAEAEFPSHVEEIPTEIGEVTWPR